MTSHHLRGFFVMFLSYTFKLLTAHLATAPTARSSVNWTAKHSQYFLFLYYMSLGVPFTLQPAIVSFLRNSVLLDILVLYSMVILLPFGWVHFSPFLFPSQSPLSLLILFPTPLNVIYMWYCVSLRCIMWLYIYIHIYSLSLSLYIYL